MQRLLPFSNTRLPTAKPSRRPSLAAARHPPRVRCSAAEDAAPSLARQAPSQPHHQPQSQQLNRQHQQHPVGAGLHAPEPSPWSGPVMSSGEQPSTSQPFTYTSQQEQQDLFESLRNNRYWARAARPPVNLLAAGPYILDILPEVNVIVFGSEEHEQEGVYSHRAVGKDGLPQDTILGFESGEDAHRYACMLEVTMTPHTPRVLHLPTEELVEFCMERGYQCRVETRGTRLVPPERNVDLTDWERSQRLKHGQYAVLEDGEVQCMGRPDLAPEQQQLLDLYLAAGNDAKQVAESPGAELLDNIRSRLEALLPPPEGDEEERGQGGLGESGAL